MGHIRMPTYVGVLFLDFSDKRSKKDKAGDTMPRKPTQIDKSQFENLCKFQCTEAEICAWFGVTDKTLSGWCRREYGTGFRDTYAVKRQAGKISLRRSQFQLAQTNATMAIWLGKQYLHQTDAGELKETTQQGLSDSLMAALSTSGAKDWADNGDKK